MPAVVALALTTVLLQVLYPLVDGPARDDLTVLTVLLFFATSVAHAAHARGARWALRFTATTVTVALLAEAVGVATGLPFGDYDYAGSLGPRVLGVPAVVPLAWAMMAYPALLAGRRLGSPLLGAPLLVAWDLFLDPQMVDAGHWTWADPSPGLNGIPLTNAVGWALVSTALMALLARLPEVAADDRVPEALLLWTWGSSVLANLVFFDRPLVALAGGLAMAPFVLRPARQRVCA